MKRTSRLKKERSVKKKRNALARKRTKRRMSFKIPLSMPAWKPILGTLLVLFFITWWVRYDPAGWFRLGKIQIAGPTEHLGIGEIEELAAPTLGIPLMLLDLDSIRNRIENHPWVRTAGLRRLLPNTLYIHVQEHTPAAILSLPENFLVSTAGIIIKKMEKKDPKNFPVITGLKKDSKENHLLHRRIQESLAIIHKLMATGVLEAFGLSEVHWENERILSLVTQRRPFKIALGEGPWQAKLDRLILVLPNVERDKRFPTRIALDNSNGVVVRYSKGADKKL